MSGIRIKNIKVSMETKQIAIPISKPRRFLPENLRINSWEILEPYFKELNERPLNSVNDLYNWMLDQSELEAVLEEDMAWRYIRMNIDTTDKNLADSFHFFITKIEPHIAPFSNAFNKKLVDSPFLGELKMDKYNIYLRGVRKQIEIFREENIPLFTELQTQQQKYGAVSALMTVKIDGKEMTLQKAASFLKELDRNQREDAYKKIQLRRLEDADLLNELYTHLIGIRKEVAKNAGFGNYRDYKFVELGRFDYTVEDCYHFHNSIEKEIVPIVEELDKERKKHLGLDKLKPWDTEVDISNKSPLKPFETGEELINKTITCFYKIRPYFGECLEIMKAMGHLNLESKKGKAPGGFNYPLYETGVPFIYMNAVGSLRDLVTMVHEGGHAIHSFLSRDLELTSFKSLPSEIAELASMSMELISMEHWDVFFEDKEDLKRARREQLEKVLGGLPWIAIVDKFQHWVYKHPTHTSDERIATWRTIVKELGSNVINWEGEEEALAISWQKQLHLFEVPFYYIEYGMAQLGAIAVWRNYKQNPEKALDQYESALKLGYTKSIGEIYETAGIKFDFSQAYIKELVDFVKGELDSN